MLGIKMSPELLSLGQSREVTNRIQRLRKTSGISIDDQIEIFYEFTGKASSKSQLGMIGKTPAMQTTAKNKFKNGRNPAMTMSLNDEKLPFARLITKAEQGADQNREAIIESNLEGP